MVGRGDPNGGASPRATREDLGQVGRYTWRSKLHTDLVFDMRTTRVERPHLLEGEASGELAGTGRWRFFEETAAGLPAGDRGAVRVERATTKAWMNLLAPVAADLPVEPRLGDAKRRHRPRLAARLQPAASD